MGMSSQMVEKTVDDWLIARSGLPARVVNRCTEAGIGTVGRLRRMGDARLRQLPGLSSKSLRHVRRFLDVCGRIVAGESPFDSLSEILDFFLKPAERDVVERRYGLSLSTPPSAARAETLQSIAAGAGVTRERVRQMQRRATAALASELAQACLDPLYRAFEGFIDERSGVATDRETAEIGLEPLGRYNPARVLVLLCDCSPRIHFFHGLFATIPADRLRAAVSRLLDALRADPGPHEIGALVNIVDDSAPADSPEARQHIVRLLLEHTDDVSCVAGDRYFLTPAGASAFVAGILRRLPAPAHFRAVQEEYNRLMRPGSRKGTGFIIGILGDETCFRRVSAGCYELAGT